MASSTLALTTTPTFDFANLGSSQGTIAPGETAYYVATYLIDQSAVDIGGVINSVTVPASSTGGVVSDTSDDGIDTDGNTTDDKTILVIDPNPILEATKTAVVSDVNSNGINDLEDIITYTITVENKGNVTLSGLTISDTLTDGNAGSLTLTTTPTFVSATTSSTSTTLAVGGVVTYTASFNINQQAVDSGSVNNSALAIASSPGNTNDVNDRSDNGDDTDGETQDDPTIVTITAGKSLEVTKTASATDLNSNGVVDLGDRITYSIRVVNTGDLTLSDITLDDTLTDANSSTLSLDSGPTFVSATTSSTSSMLQVSGVSTYTAIYTVGQQAINSGSVINKIRVTASSPGQSGNVSNTDQVTTSLPASPSLEVTKTASVTDNGDGVTGIGDIIRYTINVKNTGNISLSGLTLTCLLYTSPSPRDRG